MYIIFYILAFDVSGLIGTITKKYFSHRSIDGFIPYDFPNCLDTYKQYGIICDFTKSPPTFESLSSRFKNDIICPKYELRGLVSTSKDDRYFGCVMVENSLNLPVAISYVEFPGLNLKNIDVDPDFEKNTTVATGTLSYKWDKCVSEEHYYICKFTTEIPTEEDFDESERIQIDCNGNEIKLDDTLKRFFSCAFYNRKNIIDIEFLEIPRMDMSDISLIEKDKKWVPQGLLRYDWLKCENNVDKYKLVCQFSDSKPESVDPESGTVIEIVCGGHNLSSITTDISRETYLGCGLFDKKTNQKVDFDFVKGEKPSDSTKTLILVIVGVVAGACVIIVAIVLTFFFFKTRKEGSVSVPLIPTPR